MRRLISGQLTRFETLGLLLAGILACIAVYNRVIPDPSVLTASPSLQVLK